MKDKKKRKDMINFSRKEMRAIEKMEAEINLKRKAEIDKYKKKCCNN